MTYQEALRQQLMSKTAKRRAFGVANPPAKFEKTAENNLDLHKRGSGNIQAVIDAALRHAKNTGMVKNSAANGLKWIYAKRPTT